MIGESGRGLRARLVAGWYLLSLLTLLALLLGTLRIGHGRLAITWSPGLAALLWGAATAGLFLPAWRNRVAAAALHSPDNPWLPLVPVAALFFITISDFKLGDWYFYLDPASWRRLLLWLIPATIILAIIDWFSLGRFAYPALLLAAQYHLGRSFYRLGGGEPLYRDDHPSVLYRLWCLTKTWPQLIFYNPFWNGGIVDTSLISTGTLALGTPALPFLAIFGAWKAYMFILIGVVIVAMPWITVLTMRSLGFGTLAAYAVAFLALGVNRNFFLTMLTYGTTAALLVSFLLLVVWAILYRAVTDGQLSAPRWAAAAATLNIMIFWPPSAIILSPLLLCLLLSARRLTKRSLLFIGGLALFLLLLNARWIYSYLSLPRVANFIGKHTANRAAHIDFATALRSLAGALRQTNPLLLAIGLFGLLLPKRRAELIWLLPPLLFLAALIAVNRSMPNLQLHRMVVPLCFLLLVPAASFLDRFAAGPGWGRALLRGAVGVAALMTVLAVSRLYHNHGKETTRPMSTETHQIVDWMRTNVPNEGRVFFSGSAVHGFGGGHVAWLQAATGRGMIAGDYYHFDPRYRDYNPIPPSLRGSADDQRRWFELMGVTHVVTYRRGGVNLFPARARYGKPVLFGRKEIYATGIVPGYFQQGTGRVEPGLNRLRVHLDTAQEMVTLRFVWQEGLRVDAPVEIAPLEVAAGLSFISVRPHGATDFVIRYKR